MDASARRTGRLAALALGLAALATLAPGAHAATTQARPADSFVDSIGVNTHTYYNDTPYFSRFEIVKQRLAELGVRHIRENLVPDRPDQYERLNELAAIGAEATLILGDPTEGASGLGELISILREELQGTVAAAEGPNEFDMWGGQDWRPRLAEYCRRLYAAVRADPTLAGLPVVGPSIVHHRNQEALGNISSYLDFGNIHSYPDGYSPEGNLSRHLQYASRNSADKPVMATESGYHTAVGWAGEHNPVSEETMATYVPRMFLEYFRRGIARTFSYELLDEWDKPDRESNFGLLRNDLTPKPAFRALRNTIDILEDPGPSFSPGSLDYSLGGDRSDLRHLLLQKRDGTFYLILWRAVDVWDPEAQVPLGGSTGTVEVYTDRRVDGAEVYVPNASPAPVETRPAGASQLGLEVGPQVVILKLSASGPGAGRIKLWVSRRSVPAGGVVAVKGRLPDNAAGRPRRIMVQHWRGRKRGDWRTVGRGQTSRTGSFRKAIRLSPGRFGRVPRLRVIARSARPSRPVRIWIQRARVRVPGRARRVGLGNARVVTRHPGGGSWPAGSTGRAFR